MKAELISKWPARFIAIEDLVGRKEFSKALCILNEIAISLLCKEEYGYYCILSTEANLYLGNYSGNLIDDAIEIFRFNTATEMFARAKLLKGRKLVLLGNYDDAQEEITEAYTNYLRCNSLSDAAKSLILLSYVSLILGNTSSAMTYLTKGIDIYIQLGNNRSAEMVTQNLCCILLKVGKLRESIGVYEDLEEKIKDHRDLDRFIYYFMSPLPHALRGDIQKAKKIIANCKPFLGKYKRETTIYYENLGWIHLLDGNYDEAEKALKTGLEMALKIAPESALFSQIARLLGDLYLAKRQYNLARKYANDALKISEKIGERLEIAACYRIFAQLEQHDGNVDKAREWFKKAINLFARVDAHYELAVTRYLAAVSGSYESGERLALLYLAKEYFRAEEIVQYLEKVEGEIKKSACLNHLNNIDHKNAPVMIGKTSAIQKIRILAENVAASEMSILLTGDTGTGKDLLAKYIHHCSSRSGEFVMVNAAAIPNSMVESELFGHVKGSYTGASKDRPGLFEMADNGTLYLNEIGDASPEFQAKLLDVLETKIVRRLGENKNRKVNFRLIAATNRRLDDLLEKEIFRKDLYYRINEIQIKLPPLRDRAKDILPLVEYFLALKGLKASDNNNGLEMKAMADILSEFEWPGNIRQLKSEVNRLYIISQGGLAKMIEHLQTCDFGQRASDDAVLLRTLEKTSWNRRQAARLLGISEATVRKRIKKYDLAPSAPL